jgi:DNA-binding HxlR family transcriptional regulator
LRHRARDSRGLTAWGQALCPALDAILKWADLRPQQSREHSINRTPLTPIEE